MWKNLYVRTVAFREAAANRRQTIRQSVVKMTKRAFVQAGILKSASFLCKDVKND